MAISNIGFAGPVDVQDWYNLTRATNSIYGVADSSELIVSVKAGADRTVAISPGNAWGRGIFTTSTATESVTLPAAPSSGSRWDMVVLRRDWNTKTATFTYVKGTSTKALPTRNTAVGTLDDQPLVLARVEAGKSAVQEIVDLKCWSNNSGLSIRDAMAMDYLKQDGTTLTLGGKTYQYWDSSGWNLKGSVYDGGWANGYLVSGWNGAGSYVQARKVAMGNLYLVDLRVRVHRSGGTIDVFSNGNIADQTIGRVSAAYAPSGVSASLGNGFGDRVAGGFVASNGNIILATVGQGYNDTPIVKGDYFVFGGTYLSEG